jgi:poly(A) polymerase
MKAIFSPKNIGHNALAVLQGLKDAGFEAYLVGGCVRDLLIGLQPKDFDIVTDARPEQVRKLFRNSILIGKRFRLVHVRFGREIIEVATFRATVKSDSSEYKSSEHGMILRDNVYGTLEEDAWRRDFTVNALYYRINDLAVIDYTGGLQDLKNKTIRMIGDPIKRYSEDPVRMLRAIRLAAKLNFKIEKNTAAPIAKLKTLITHVATARLFEEVSKWFRSSKSLAVFHLLQKYNLFAILFPSVVISLNGKRSEIVAAILEHGFANTDKRISEGKTINPAFLYAVLLWWPLQDQIEILRENKKLNEFELLRQAMRTVLQQQKSRVLLPHKLMFTIKDIWMLQYQLAQKKRQKIQHLFAHPKFRAAYDFLLLRAEAGEAVKEAANWWTEFQNNCGICG